jgi:processive 1,2-diacylglycerol beta-glucosyltransferase
VRTHVVDAYRYAASVVSRVVSNGYLQMVKTIPQMYRYIYRRAERASEVGRFRTWAHQWTASNLRPLIESERPDVIVCTHAFPCGAMAEYKKLYSDAPPVAGIVTDFAVHGFWIHNNVDAYAVATDAMRQTMVARGIAAERIMATGIPVDPRFARREPVAELRARLELPRDRQVVLMMGGGLGLSPLAKLIGALAEVEIPVCAVIIVGRNQRLETKVLAAADETGCPLRVLRFVDNVYDYMHASDVLVTKPGGLTTAEALVAGVPTVLFKPLPGQEERNVRFLTERYAAIRSRTMDDVVDALRELLSSPERRERMRAAMQSLAKPRAAADIADLILRLARRKEALV